MSQARVLNPQELRRVLDHVATRRHSARNRAMLLLTHYAGMRVGEVAALRINDVLNSDKEYVINNQQTPNSIIQSVFSKLEIPHLQHVIDKINSTTTKITNIKNYVITCLYNSVLTLNLDIANFTNTFCLDDS
jgi:integrase